MTEPTLTLNGKEETVQGVAPTTPLLTFLRQRGFVGTKEGCAEGDCGACTVVVAQNGQLQAVNSCLVPLASVLGKDLLTVEGVANGALHPVQEAMIETGGSQCGYCTPGFVMSIVAAQSNDELNDEAIEGNLCRCTGYLPIRRAMERLESSDISSPYPSAASTPRVPTPYQHGEQHFFRPMDLQEVFRLMNEHPDAKLIAGGTDLGVEINKFHREFPVLISLEEVSELKTIDACAKLSEGTSSASIDATSSASIDATSSTSIDATSSSSTDATSSSSTDATSSTSTDATSSTSTSSYLELGAATPLTHIEKEYKGMFPALDEMLRWFAARQIRNRATLGGNLGTASPIGDLPPVLLALDAELKLASVKGERTVPIAEFFKGYRQTSLEPGEVIVSVRLPKEVRGGASKRLSQAYKVGKRGADDISIVAAAFTVDLDNEGYVVHSRLAYGGVAATPMRAVAAEEVLSAQPWNIRTVREVKEVLATTFEPIDDLRGSASYRTRLICNLFEKFFHEFSARQEVSA